MIDTKGQRTTHSDPPRAPLANRLWAYQRERFPLLGHGPLIAAFSFCAVSLSGMLRGAEGWPRWSAVTVAFVTCLTFFFQLRVADEFKDLDEDTRYRPYRPVPRGLITLRELAVLFAVGSAVQLALALWLDVRLILLLLIAWAYLALMSKEFFVRDWLRGRHVLYMTSHMLIMPIVDLYATSTDWLPTTGRPPAGLLAFLAASYFNGLVIEIGRKIRSPGDEEEGVDTYSRVWGRTIAVSVWWVVMSTTAIFAIVTAHRLNASLLLSMLLGGCLTAGLLVGVRFLKKPAKGRGKSIEVLSGIWTLCLYLGLGFLPRVVSR